MAQHQILVGPPDQLPCLLPRGRTAPSGPPEMGKRPLLWGTGGPGDEGADSCPLWSPPTHARSHTLTTRTHITDTSTPSRAHTHLQWHRAPLPCKTGHPHTRLHPTSTGPAHRGAPGAIPSEAPRKPAPPLRPDSRPTHRPVLSQGLWSRSRGGLSPGGGAGGGLLAPRTVQERVTRETGGRCRPLGSHCGHRLRPRKLAGSHTDGVQPRPTGECDHSKPTGQGPPPGPPPDGRRTLRGAWGRHPAQG